MDDSNTHLFYLYEVLKKKVKNMCIKVAKVRKSDNMNDNEESMNSNKTAVKNGLNAESVFKNFMSKYEYNLTQLNDLIDFMVNGHYVEIKSCQKEIYDSSHQNFRSGRFVMNKGQHQYLVSENGYYYFMLYNYKDSKIERSKFILAKNIKYQRLICWKRIFEEG